MNQEGNYINAFDFKHILTDVRNGEFQAVDTLHRAIDTLHRSHFNRFDCSVKCLELSVWLTIHISESWGHTIQTWYWSFCQTSTHHFHFPLKVVHVHGLAVLLGRLTAGRSWIDGNIGYCCVAVHLWVSLPNETHHTVRDSKVTVSFPNRLSSAEMFKRGMYDADVDLLEETQTT